MLPSHFLESGPREPETIDLARHWTRDLAHAVIVGMGTLRTYSLTPGVAGTPDTSWPAGSLFLAPPGSFTLVMVIHPHCPCSRASIGELSILMAHSGGKLAAYVVFVEPPGFGERWTKTDLWSSAGSIPGVRRIIDRGGEAKLFGAATSGPDDGLRPRRVAALQRRNHCGSWTLRRQ